MHFDDRGIILLPMGTATPNLRRTTAGLYAALTVAYVALAVIFTWPLILRFTTHTPAADASGDQFQTIWFFWWMKKALFALHLSPYWTNEIYFPYGTGLAYHLSPFTSLLAIAISTVTGTAINSAAVFNTLLLLSFVITGLAAFLLIRQVTGNALAAFWGSVFVTVAPYRLWHTNHLNLLSFGWGILSIHFVMRLLATATWRHALAAVITFGVLFYASLSDAALVLFFLIAYVAVNARTLWSHPRRARIIRMILVTAALVLVVILPGLIALWATDAPWNLRWPDTEAFSADFVAHLIPAHATSATAQWLGLDGGFAPGYGAEVFLGWLLVGIAVAVVVIRRRQVSYRWLILVMVFLILSLGPTLKIGSHRLLPGLLPYRWLFEWVPFLNLSRTPGRFVVLTQLCLVVFAAQGLDLWVRRARERIASLRLRIAWASVATVALVAILSVEYTDGSAELWEMTVPEVYHELAADSTIHAIYEAPIATASQICNRYMYWQTFHGKKVANGYLTHASRMAWVLLDRIKNWQQFGDAERNELLAAGIDAIVYHEPSAPARLIPLHGRPSTETPGESK